MAITQEDIIKRRKLLWEKRRALGNKIKFTKVDIYKYNTLTDYLKAWYKKNKKIYPNLFSYELIANRFGNKSKSGIYRIFQGKKSPSNQKLNKLIKVMELSPEEANYLILLSHFSKVKKRDTLKAKLIKGYKQHLKKRK